MVCPSPVPGLHWHFVSPIAQSHTLILNKPYSILWSCTTVLLTRLHLNLKALGVEPRSEEDLGNNVNMKNINVSIQFRHSTPISIPLATSPSPVPAAVTAKRGKKKIQWKRKNHDVDSFYNQAESNIFPGGTAIYTREPDAYFPNENVAITRPGTAA